MKLLLFCAALCVRSALYAQDSAGKAPNNISPFDIVITEFMADPDPPVGLPAQEYCEIYNRGLIPINLLGWSFFDGSSHTLPAVSIDPDEYVIICDDNDTALFSLYGKCAAINSISLTNTGEKIALRDAAGLPIDSIIYSDSWLGDTYKKDGGWSVEKVDLDFTCPVSDNWQPSHNLSGGTPGIINSVNGSLLDTQAPLLLRSFCSDSVSLVLVFNEALDPDEALILQHYSTSASSPIEVSFEDEFLERVKLTLPSPITPGIAATISVSGLKDCSGNLILPGTTVRSGLADFQVNAKLVINEILFNPFAEGYDFIELHHAGSGIIDLSNYKIQSYDLSTGQLSESQKISEESWLMFPGEYCIISEVPDKVALQYLSSFPYNFIQLVNFPSMNIDEGHFAISFNDTIIDEFHYFENYHFELLTDHKGISLEKINPVFNSADPGSWHSAAESAGFATPGLKNSQYSEIVPGSNNISLMPEIFSPDNDGIDDVLTILLKTGTPGYISNIRIYTSDGLLVKNNAKNLLPATLENFTWDGITDSGERAPVGIYVAVAELFNLQGSAKTYRLPFVLALKL